MNNSHISNFGSFGRALEKFADAQGFVWWADVEGIGELENEELVDMAQDYDRDYEERAAAAVELAARRVRSWRAQ